MHAFDGPVTFTPDFARQFEAVGSDGDHDHCMQVVRSAVWIVLGMAGQRSLAPESQGPVDIGVFCAALPAAPGTCSPGWNEDLPRPLPPVP
ncbi:hypothetical protein [Streptomyces sp. NPDC059994]|uniref:hypothetical protein n=1 Tax=Streptomyces sp. NPDC059994 TaxID=3347029 RepID=UPI00367B143F